MSSLIDRFRSGANRAAFEAEKARRLVLLQNKTRSLEQQLSTGATTVGRIAFQLHQEGHPLPKALRDACAPLMAFQAELQTVAAEAEAVRNEVFVDESGGAEAYGQMCPNGHGVLPAGHQFCQTCGAKAVYVPPPATGSCVHCGAPLEAGARFCTECGKTAAQQTVTTERRCPNCNTPTPPDARFCNECGTILTAPAAPAPTASPTPPAPPAPPVILEESQVGDKIILPPAELLAAASTDAQAAEPLAAAPEPDAGEDPAAAAELAVPLPDLPLPLPMPVLMPELLPVEPADSPPATPLPEDVPTVAEASNPAPQPAAAASPTNCVVCSAQLLPGAAFCANCGHAVG